MIVAYLTISELKDRSIMPPEEIDLLPVAFVNSRIAIAESEVNSVLRKRYAAPFASPVPEIVLAWVTDLVTPELYFRRGWDPTEKQSLEILAAAERVRAQLQQAADQQGGLWDLPLRQDSNAEGVSKGGTKCYSEASAYDWLDAQREALINGSGRS